MTCPKCAFKQDGGYECQRCGVIFSKAQGARPRPSTQPTPSPSLDTRGGGPGLKTFALVLILLMGGGLFATVRANPYLLPVWFRGPSPWLEGMDGLDEGLAVLEDTGAPTFVLFYTDWCPHCKRLDALLNGVKELDTCTGSGTRVRLNIDESREAKALHKDLGFKGIPRIVV